MTPTISIAIPTRNHPGELADCLRSLVPVRGKAMEVIVVDNASEGDATQKAAEEFGARYLREPAIGLVRARNLAVREAKGEVIAFLDDDCQVAPGWLDAVGRAFSDPMVGAVTGQAISGKDTNWVQRQFDSYARGFCQPEPVEMTPEDVGDIYCRAVVGVGANMAFRRALLVALDGFTEVTRCGEDDYMLFSVVREGYKVRYTPDSIVYQKHRTGLVSTLLRMIEYGVGGMRVLWYLSAEDKSFALFVKNAWWVLYRNELMQFLRSAKHLRLWHALFSLASLSGFFAGLFLPWGWRAHILGELPARGGLNPLEYAPSKTLPVLMYHRVGPDLPGTYRELTVSPGRFKEHMEWLKRNGYSTVGTGDWLAWRREGNPLPQKPVLLTFDDAYEALVEHAFPVLKEYGFTGTVFVVTGEIGGENTWDRNEGSAPIKCMSGEQIRHWSAEGIEFGAHTRTHADLTTLSGSGLEMEVAKSRDDLAAILGAAPLSFAYPFGHYNDAARCCAEKVFQLAFTCDEGLNAPCAGPALMRRTMVKPRDSRLDFALRVRFGYSPVERLRNRVRLRSRLRDALRMFKGV
jgi:peptidoglycan/xylan/chitin deacetylase (PgdA/CDA1 family)/glycosyltransferase involved in cell wall biosynthesis